MMKFQLCALIVAYGSDPMETMSLKTLLSAEFPREQLRVLIWDNSPQPNVNHFVLRQLGVDYLSTPENLGLSVIYNRVIAEYLLNGEYLLLLDQDTLLPNNFLLICEAAVQQQLDIDLFLPMIWANNSWVSPLTYMMGWGYYWRHPRVGRMASRKICAINSGMLISAAYLKNDFPGYDERLRFYGTDTQFMLEYIERRSELVVLDVCLEHDLSFFSDSIQNRVSKFRTMRTAYQYIYEFKPFWQLFGVKLVLGLVAMVYAVRYRDFRFLKLRP